jgi:hypothetical protein
MARPRTHRKLRASHRAVLRAVAEDLARHGQSLDLPRWARRGHDIDPSDFLPAGWADQIPADAAPETWGRYLDGGHPDWLPMRVAWARWLGWLRTLLALAAPPVSLPVPRSADEEPVSVEPADVLTPRLPNAPCGRVSWEALAA